MRILRSIFIFIFADFCPINMDVAVSKSKCNICSMDVRNLDIHLKINHNMPKRHVEKLINGKFRSFTSTRPAKKTKLCKKEVENKQSSVTLPTWLCGSRMGDDQIAKIKSDSATSIISSISDETMVSNDNQNRVSVSSMKSIYRTTLYPSIAGQKLRGGYRGFNLSLIHI